MPLLLIVEVRQVGGRGVEARRKRERSGARGYMWEGPKPEPRCHERRPVAEGSCGAGMRVHMHMPMPM